MNVGIITIDLRERKLIYEQIIDCVKLQISRGVLKENDFMPSVRSLAAELGINPNTIQKAYAELERQGVIVSVPGRGSIVSVNSDAIVNRRIDEIYDGIKKLVVEAKNLGATLNGIQETVCNAYNGS